MMLTRRGVASVLVTLLFLGCAAGPNPGGIAPEAGTAAERNRAAMERPADPIAYLHLVRAHYHAEAAEWPQAVAELRQALDRDPRSADALASSSRAGSDARAPTPRRSRRRRRPSPSTRGGRDST